VVLLLGKGPLTTAVLSLGRWVHPAERRRV